MIRRLSTHLLAILALVSAVSILGQAESQPTLTHHVWQVTQNGRAKAVGHLPANQSMRLVLSLPLRNQGGLEDMLRDMYDPSSSIYRQFLTVERFTEMFGPTQDDYNSVIRFAEANGLRVVKTSANRVNLDVSGSVANIEKALHVNLNTYQHDTENRTFFAPDKEPTLELGVQLWHVSGLDNYSTPQRALAVRNQSSSPSHVIGNATTGSCPQASFCGSDMRPAYYGGTTLTGAGQTLGLLEYAGTDLADLTTYYKNAKQTNNVPITLDSVDGVTTSCLASQGCDDTEQTIDMTQAIGMAPGLSSLVMYIGNGDPLDDAGILNAMATASPLNAQLSSSWEWKPADPTTDNPYFLEFAAQGQNFFEASGDSGKWTSTGFVWPADSVYVTTVGGTDLNTTGPGGAWASETGWIGSGGGISPNKYAIPSWQVAAAAGCTSCSQVYRNGPDVSANANYSFYVCADQTTCTANLYGGTSFATPMWAGYLALANEQNVTNGNPTLGFINPTLYTLYGGSSYDTDFHDITSGSNGTYTATVGYDLVTGIGSPNGANLINALAPATADFAMTATPSKLKIAQGAVGRSKITTTISGSFDSSVALSAKGQGTGVTVSFNPATIAAPGKGSSTMSIKVAATAKAGVETITVTGTGGGKTHTATVMIDVTN